MKTITKEELLKEAKEIIRYEEIRNIPLLSGIYIIQQRKLHDSGYRLMYVIGHTKNFEYYLLDTCSDVVDFESYWSKIPLEDLHIDINKNGIIHVWSNTNLIKCRHAVSSCFFDVVGGSR
jgi:hypothetical protein